MELSTTADTIKQDMYIDDITGAIITCAEAEGWKVDASIYYKEMTSYFEFSKFSPAGRDFSFSAEMKCANINSLIEHLEDYYAPVKAPLT